MRSMLSILVLMLLCCAPSCSRHTDGTALPAGHVRPRVAALLAPDTGSPYDHRGIDAPDGACRPLRLRRRLPPFGKAFGDLNDRHLAAARAGGIHPIAAAADTWRNGAGLVRLRPSRYVSIDSLTHSYPFLVPHAADLVQEIGRRFADSLRAHGGGDYRLKLTSALRSDSTVGRLRRVNRNATSESAHRYGTTFDISHSRFVCDSDTGVHRSFDDLARLLAVIVYDLRQEGRCVVKHERRQACFHITSLPPNR